MNVTDENEMLNEIQTSCAVGNSFIGRAIVVLQNTMPLPRSFSSIRTDKRRSSKHPSVVLTPLLHVIRSRQKISSFSREYTVCWGGGGQWSLYVSFKC